MPVSIGKSGSSKITAKKSFKLDGTIHSHHKETMSLFEKRKYELPEMKKELNDLKAKLAKFTDGIDEDNYLILKKLSNRIDELTQYIEKIKKQDTEYFLNVGPLLFKYYNYNVGAENQSIDKNKKWLQQRMEKSNSETQNKKIGFRPKRLKPIRTSNRNQTGKKEMLDEFKSILDPKYVKKSESKNKVEESICIDCQIPKILQYRESKFICPQCGIEETTLIDSDRPSFKDPPPEANYFAYKRINHFNELLAQFQAKESTHIPKDVFEIIKEELKKNRKTVKDLNYKLVKDFLKKHSDKKYNQYYDHIFHIINRLNGDKPLNMTPEMENNLRFLFLQIQEPFEKYCPPDRKNFISYNFVFYKFCQMLGYREFLKYFPLLKSKDKLYDQEKIWQKIMQDIGITYK